MSYVLEHIGAKHMWTRGLVGYDVALTWRRSRVRLPSGPLLFWDCSKIIVLFTQHYSFYPPTKEISSTKKGCATKSLGKRGMN